MCLVRPVQSRKMSLSRSTTDSLKDAVCCVRDENSFGGDASNATGSSAQTTLHTSVQIAYNLLLLDDSSILDVRDAQMSEFLLYSNYI